MNQTKKSRKLLIGATIIMIIALSSILTVYAAVLLGTFTGGDVTVGGITSATITYSIDGTTAWSSTLNSGAPGNSWYSKIVLGSGYTGPATITWQLQKDGSPVSGATITTTKSIAPGDTVYATLTGVQSGNLDWDKHTPPLQEHIKLS